MSVWQQIGTTIQQEFSDIPDVSDLTRIVLRMTMAIVLGGIIGYERETRGMAAGLRTHMLVALGAAMLVMVPAQAGMDVADMSRVLQGVIAGIGFLGAGAIIKLRNEHEIRGLTTAASIWLTAAIGIAAGMGRESTALLSALMALFILSMLGRFSHQLGKDLEKNGQPVSPDDE